MTTLNLSGVGLPRSFFSCIQDALAALDANTLAVTRLRSSIRAARNGMARHNAARRAMAAASGIALLPFSEGGSPSLLPFTEGGSPSLLPFSEGGSVAAGGPSLPFSEAGG